jgi:hypothetical protein
MKNLITIYLTRALLAAAIAWIMGTSLYFVATLVRYTGGHAALPNGVLIEFATAILPTVSGYLALLVSLMLLPTLALWFSPLGGRWFSRTWVAAFIGVVIALLISPFWMQALQGYFQRGGPYLSWGECLGRVFSQSPYIAFTGGLFGFLQAFFVKRALAKKAWLESAAVQGG